MTVKRWIYVGIGIVIVVLMAILGWWIYKLYNKATRFESMYYQCLSGPADTVIVWRDRVIFSDDTIKPKPRRTIKIDTVYLPGDCPCDKINYYADSYKKDGLRIRWEATTKGTLESLQFPNIIIPDRYITVEKKVPVHDTIVTNVELSHWGLYAKLFVNNFKVFPGIDAGVMYTFKGKGGIMVGGMYNPGDNLPYFTAGIYFNFK